MKPDEIRTTPIEATCDVATDQNAPQINACAFFLRELCAQVAELNEHLRAKATKGTAQTVSTTRSMNRRTSKGKMFRVEHWQLTVDGDTLREFTPNEGQKALDDLEINESSIGKLGTVEDAKITRVVG